MSIGSWPSKYDASRRILLQCKRRNPVVRFGVVGAWSSRVLIGSNGKSYEPQVFLPRYSRFTGLFRHPCGGTKEPYHRVAAQRETSDTCRSYTAAGSGGR